VQPSVFFYWQCFEPDAVFQPGVLAYPFDCKPTTTTPLEQQPLATTLTETVFKPSLEALYEVNIEEAVVYGSGQTVSGGRVDLLLDLAVPDTETDGLRPLMVHIHGGGFTGGSRWPQWNWAARGWVAASIDYRLAGDDPLPGPRVQGFFEAVGGKSAPAVHRSAIAAVEDTLVALDYLLGRADELAIDTNRIVLKGTSAGAFTALHVAYCADEFGIDHPTITAVVDYSGAIARTCGEGAAIDPGEAALFVVHGTDDTGETSFSRALNIVDGAKAARITYAFYPLEGIGHNWNPVEQTAANGRTVDDLMYEFLDSVLYGE
jgi:acetyl esterase/lipase